MIFRSFDISTNTASVVHDFTGVINGGVICSMVRKVIRALTAAIGLS